MSLTVCIVVYNEEKNLSVIQQNLQILSQHAPSISLLLLDNASTDRTSFYLKQIADRLSARFIQRTQNHLPRARHQALMECNTDWISFIDADCLIDIPWVECVQSLCASDDNTFAAYGGPWRMVGPAALRYQSLFGSFLGHFGHPYLKLDLVKKSVSHLPTANILYRSKTVLKVGGFSSTHWRVGEDLDLSLRLTQAGYKILYVPQMSIFHELPSSLKAWAHKMWIYGTARGELVWKYKSGLNYQWLLPLIFCVMILLSLLVDSTVLMVLAAGYLVLCGVCSFFSAPAFLQTEVLLWMITTHFCYSLGILSGLLRALFWPAYLEPKRDPQDHKVPVVEHP